MTVHSSYHNISNIEMSKQTCNKIKREGREYWSFDLTITTEGEKHVITFFSAKEMTINERSE